MTHCVRTHLGLVCFLVIDTNLTEAVAESIACNPEQPGGLALVSARAFESLLEDALFILVERHSRRKKGWLSGCLARSGAHVDPDFARILKDVGPPVRREMPTGFGGLMRSIVGQQVSVHAARAIWLRLEAAVQPMEPAVFLRQTDEQLRAVGLSGSKVKYGRSLASDIVEGRIDFAGLHRLDDAAAVKMLTQAKGIGPWTAEIYLMFAHGRPDIMPGLDLGLVVAAQHLKKLRTRPTPERLLKIAELWRPWRSAAALLLWHYRRSMPDWGPKPLKEDAKAGKK